MHRHCVPRSKNSSRKISTMPSLNEVSPQARLEITRKAIVRHMNRDHWSAADDDRNLTADEIRQPRKGLLNAWDSITHAVLLWWHRHPASAVVELARPLMKDYAGSHPFKLLSVSAGVGIAVVLVKPWRMMSLGSWLVAAVKSSGLTSAAVSWLSRPRRKSETNYLYNNP